MKAGLWIAERYSFARKRFRVINIISAISLAGIIVGVCTLLVVMSVLNGFQKLARDLFTTVESPVQLIHVHDRTMQVTDSLLLSLRSIDGVASAHPFSEGEAILSSEDKSELVIVKGLTDDAQTRLMQQTKKTVPYVTPGSIASGELLSYRTGLYPGRMVKIFSPELISLGLESLSQPYLLPALTITDARVQTVFSLQKIFDDRYVLTSGLMAQKILLMSGDQYSGIDIRGREGLSDAELQKQIGRWIESNGMGKKYRLRPLDEKYRDIFAVMKLEKWVSFSVLMLIIVVAVLSLTGSLAMTVIDKQRELFYLRCLGLEKRQFMTIFILEGGMTGLAGTAIGTVLAWVICRVQEVYGIVELPSKSAFIIDTYPVSMSTADFLVVGLSTLILCLLVSLYPALKAAGIAASHSLETKTN
jgi:lipoprotein-releasing system permease protein